MNNPCELCGELFPECECQSVKATCSTCHYPIFGSENAGRRDHKIGAYTVPVYTCEVCLDEQRRVA
jgi:hypothetical protein